MKIGFFSDVHGNLEALNLCLQVLRHNGADQFVFVGDAIGYLPYSIECLDVLQDLQPDCITGNHEAMLIGTLPLSDEKDDFYKIRAVQETIGVQLKKLVSTWPETRTLEINNKKVLVVHGSPTDHLGGYIYPDADLSSFRDLPFDVIVLGQTHRPFIRSEYGKLFVNVGSVGLPRDQGDTLSCGLLDTESFQFDILRHRFDIDPLLADQRIHPEIRRVFQRKTDDPVGRLVA